MRGGGILKRFSGFVFAWDVVVVILVVCLLAVFTLGASSAQMALTCILICWVWGEEHHLLS